MLNERVVFLMINSNSDTVQTIDAFFEIRGCIVPIVFSVLVFHKII